MDDLEADIRAAVEGTASTPAEGVAPASIPSEPAAASQAPAAPAPKVDDRPRDEAGKFAPKADAPKTEATKVDAKAAAPTAAAPVAAQPAPAAPTTQPIPAPANWKGAGKVQWDKLPEPVRKEISEDYTRFSQSQARLERFDAAIGKDREQVLAATYGSVEQGIQNLFAISDMATKNPQGFVLWFCQQRGINLAQMVGQPQQPGEEPAQAPDPVMQRMTKLETMLTTMAQQQQQGAQAPVLAEVDRFAADPAHPYFNDVSSEMMALLQAGRVKGGSPSERLQNAYDMAVWAHPEIRTTLIDSQVQQRTSQQADAATQAINASVSVSGSPSGAKIASEEPDETLEQTIRRAQRASGG